MLSVAKSCLAVLFVLCATACHAKSIHILILGEAIGSNCNEFQYQSVPGVHQLDLNGRVIPAVDPLSGGGGCMKGSIWIPLGERLIASGIAQEVVFVHVSANSAKVDSFKEGGELYAPLINVLRIVAEKKAKIDYALWMQGASEKGISAVSYATQLQSLIRAVESKVTVDRWLVATYSGCFGNIDPEVARAQRRLGGIYFKRMFAGPDVNSVEARYWSSSCALNRAGQQKLAEAWMPAILNSSAILKKIETETLLKFFK